MSDDIHVWLDSKYPFAAWSTGGMPPWSPVPDSMSRCWGSVGGEGLSSQVVIANRSSSFSGYSLDLIQAKGDDGFPWWFDSNQLFK